MLQFATSSNKRFTSTEQVQLALKGGGMWVRLTGKVDAEEAEPAVKMCTEAGAILIIDNDIALVDKLRVHGVHFTSWTRGSLIAARETLGPHAIIGVTCTDIAAVEELRGLDVDYVTFPLPEAAKVKPEAAEAKHEGTKATPEGVEVLPYYASVVKAVEAIKHPEFKLHPVASGSFPDEMLTQILDTGIEGFEMSESFISAPDPVYAIEKVNEILSDYIGDRVKS